MTYLACICSAVLSADRGVALTNIEFNICDILCLKNETTATDECFVYHYLNRPVLIGIEGMLSGYNIKTQV